MIRIDHKAIAKLLNVSEKYAYTLLSRRKISLKNNINNLNAVLDLIFEYKNKKRRHKSGHIRPKTNPNDKGNTHFINHSD